MKTTYLLRGVGVISHNFCGHNVR